MNFSDAPPFKDLGNVVAVGVMAAFVLSVTFLPAVMAICPVRTHKVMGGYTRQLSRLAEFVIRRRNAIFVSTIIVSLGILAFIPRIELNDQFVRYFDEDISFRSDTDFVMANLTGTYQVHFSVPSGETNGASNPEYLAGLEEFTSWLRQHPKVAHVSTLSDTTKRLNKNMHGDDPDWYRVPEEKELAAQYLLLYEFSLPFGLDLNNQLDIDKSASQAFVTLIDVSSRELREFVESAESKLASIDPRLQAPGIGTAVMFSYISERNIKGMLGGIFIGLVIISFILIFALRSVKLGLVSLIPNLLPAGLAFGIWSILIGQVNMAVSVVAAVTLGIVVDDTVHFLSKYLRARREQNLSAEDSVRYAFSTVGMALVITTVILAFGFAVLGYSSFEINSSMATLTAIAILIALVVDFLLLPPLLMQVDGDQEPVVEYEMESSGEPQTVS